MEVCAARHSKDRGQCGRDQHTLCGDQEQEQLTRDRLQALLRTWRDGVVDKGPEVFQG